MDKKPEVTVCTRVSSRFYIGAIGSACRNLVCVKLWRRPDSATLIAAMTFSMQLQLSYLWLHRHLELDPAQALLSPLAYEGDMWLSIGGCVGFLTEEQDAKNFSSAVLLSEHSVLAKDHRKLLLRLEGGADDRVSDPCSVHRPSTRTLLVTRSQ